MKERCADVKLLAAPLGLLPSSSSYTPYRLHIAGILEALEALPRPRGGVLSAADRRPFGSLRFAPLQRRAAAARHAGPAAGPRLRRLAAEAHPLAASGRHAAMGAAGEDSVV